MLGSDRNMLKKFCEKHYIVLKKGQDFHIVIRLLVNCLMRMRLSFHKWIRGNHRLIVHYYAVCWNEEKILPFVFQYYECFVDRFIFYDNYSNDHSESIIRSHRNTEIIRFQTEGFDDTKHNDIKNNCWKHSRGKADFVIVCDTDELLFHKDILQKLSLLKHQKYSIVKPFGYNMYSVDYPCFRPEHPITEQVQRGVRVPMFDKCILFDPHAIVEINYKPGAHECYPWGRVKWYRNEEIKLLHYKNIGLDQLIERNRLYASRLSKENVEKNYGTEYLKKEQLIIQEFKDNEQNTIEII